MKIFQMVACTVGLLACSEAQERPPPASDLCGGKVCSLAPVSGAHPSQSGNLVLPSAEPSPSAPPAEEAELVGDVVLLSSPDLQQIGRPLREPLTIYGPASKSGAVEAVFEPGGEFRLLVGGAAPWWLRVAPSNDSPELVTTLQGVFSPGRVRLAVVERAMLADISNGLVQNPAALDPARGYAILQVVDRAGAAVAGVHAEASSGIVAYDIGETYTDAADATAARGAIAIFNIVARAAPGIEASVQLTLGDLERVSSFPVVSGALTTAVIEIPER